MTDHLKAMLERAKAQGRVDGLHEAQQVLTTLAATYGPMPAGVLRAAAETVKTLESR